ncbi:MAG: hypothetical protein ACT4QG_10935 [Sporichthyaceae bacterium]
MTRHLARAVAAALLAPALLLTPSVAAAATTGHVPAPSWDDNEPDGQWWDYQGPSESAGGMEDDREARAARADDEEAEDADELREQPNRRSFADEPSGPSGENDRRESRRPAGENEPQTDAAPRTENRRAAAERPGRDAEGPATAAGDRAADAKTKVAPEYRKADPYDAKGAEPKPAAKAKGKKQ